MTTSAQFKFANLENGEIVEKFMLTSDQLSVSIITFGAAITEIILHECDNLDVTPGHDVIDGYLENPFKMGASVGRVINRIKGGKCTIDGETFELDKNFNNTHCIHGGRKDFVHYNWKLEELADDSVTLSHMSPDGDMGFPGTLKVFATFLLVENTLSVTYEATTDKATPVNLTCHAYFNLAGHAAGKEALKEHSFQLNADNYLMLDQDFLPIKEEPVEGTDFDFRTEKHLGSLVDTVNDGVGFDNYFCVTKEKRNSWHARAMYKDVCLEMSSNQPGFQFYNNYYINVEGGKENASYKRHCSFAFEAHGYPDAVNHPEFPSIILKPGEEYKNVINFNFYTKK